jgi:uncharacterized protein (DUF111 family)
MAALTGRAAASTPAKAMRQWPYSGSHVHSGAGVSEDDRPFALRRARCCARNPLSLDRLDLISGRVDDLSAGHQPALLLDAFTRGEPRADDVTLLTVRWAG